MGNTERSLSELAEYLDAVLIGDAEHRISGIADLQCASTSELSFVNQESYLQYLPQSATGAIILNANIADKYAGDAAERYTIKSKLLEELDLIDSQAAEVLKKLIAINLDICQNSRGKGRPHSQA